MILLAVNFSFNKCTDEDGPYTPLAVPLMDEREAPNSQDGLGSSAQNLCVVMVFANAWLRST